jgi:hypothetical protein
MEITDDMIAAGVRVYQEFCPDTCAGSALDAPMIREVLKEALLARGLSREASGCVDEPPRHGS